jgi:hypothetical protein
MTGMQPESKAPLGGAEQQPVQPAQNAERIPVMPSPESGIETGAERVEQRAEAQAAAADAAATGAPIMPVATDPVTPVTSSPVTAADDEVIEKEWVDKAKQIILETRDDPHSRTEKVNQLQKDYLKKRYGKELGAA